MSEAADDSLQQKAFDLQAALCRHFRGPLYAELLARAGRDDAVSAIVADWPGDLMRDFVALRVMGGVHQLVLTGAAPALAAHYPTAGGTPSFPGAWTEFRRTLVEHRDFLRGFLATTPQTNEIGRSAALALGFHAVAREFGLPLRLREPGASAGLNLLWDHYSFAFGASHWGPPDGRPLLTPDWSGDAPPLAEKIQIESRAGCDLAPIRLANDAARARLQSYVRADQPHRLARLRAAIEIALEHPPRLDAARAGDWLESELGTLPDGTATVVYHSSFWLYVPLGEQQRIRACIERAGANATRQRALAWLRLEDLGDGHDMLRLRCWPDGSHRTLAESDPHGRTIRWIGGAPEPA